MVKDILTKKHFAEMIKEELDGAEHYNKMAQMLYDQGYPHRIFYKFLKMSDEEEKHAIELDKIKMKLFGV